MGKGGERKRRSKEREGGRGSALLDGSMKVMAPSVSLLFVSGSRDAVGKWSRNRALVLPGSPSRHGESLG